MMDSSESTSRCAGPLLHIDKGLLAAAIWEVSLAYRPGAQLNEVGTLVVRGGRTFFLLILLELMLPGIRPDQLQQLLSQFAVAGTFAPSSRTQSAETKNIHSK